MSKADVQEAAPTEAEQFANVVSQFGAAIGSLVQFAIQDSRNNQDWIKHEWYRLGILFRQWYDREVQ